MLPWHPPEVWWLIADPELNMATVTMPGHDPDVGRLARAFAWEIEKSMASGPVVGEPWSEEDMLRGVLDHARRRGLPAVSAAIEGDCIVVQVARPAGHG